MKKPTNKTDNSKKNKDHFIHKHGYGYLFSNRVFVEELIRDFVDEEFYKQLDFDTFEPCLEKTYIGDDFKEFAEDLLIKVKLDGKDAFLYLLLEFQSTDDYFMPLRVLNYTTHFYLDFIKENPKAKMLPPVMPIVLYNGNQSWTAPDNIKDLIEPAYFVEQFYPNFKYFKIIEKSIPKSELENISNAVSTMFMIENTPKEEIEQIVVLFERIMDTESLDTIKLLCIWVEHLLKNERIGGKLYKEVISLRNAKEVKSMLLETLQEVKNEWKAEGVSQGLSKGHVEEAQDSLLDVLKARLKDIPSATEKKIRNCNNLSKLRKALLQAIWVKSWDEFKF